MRYQHVTGQAWKLFGASIREPSPVVASRPLQRLRRQVGDCPSSTQLMVIPPPSSLVSPSHPAMLSAGRAATGSHLVTSPHVGDTAVSVCWMLCDSCNHHAKCIIHKLFSVTFCTVALIIIITEAQ